jgi:hypothetical protein
LRCMLLGTVPIFISIFLCCKPNTGGARRPYFNCSCLLMTTDMYCVFSVNCSVCSAITATNVSVVLWWLGFCVCLSTAAICDCTNMHVACRQLMAYGSGVKSGVQETGSTGMSTTTSCTVCIRSALIPSGYEPAVDSIITHRSKGWWLPCHSAMEAYV